MARSSVEKLPTEIRSQLEEWLREFHAGRLTLDEVMERMDAQFADQADVDLPSRSAVHRHADKFKRIAERVQRSKDIADQLVAQVGHDIADGKGLQVLIQGFQSLAFDMLANVGEDQVLDPENLMFLAKSIGEVARAQKTDADRWLKVKQDAEKEAAKKAAEAVDRVAKRAAGGLTKDTVEAIKREILGIGD